MSENVVPDVESVLLNEENKKTRREELLRSFSAKSFLNESSEELDTNSKLRMDRRLWYVMLYTCLCFFGLWISMYAFVPSSDISISWDKTVLDIETSSVTRTIRVDIKNNNFYTNYLKKLYIEEYVRTCNDPKDEDCDWQLVEAYSQGEDSFEMDGYEDVELEIDSVHKGIDITKALDISEACMDDRLTLKFIASWKWSGVLKTYKNKIERVYCEIEDPYELSLSTYGYDIPSDPESFYRVDAKLLKNDRMEQIKRNLRFSKFQDGRFVQSRKKHWANTPKVQENTENIKNFVYNKINAYIPESRINPDPVELASNEYSSRDSFGEQMKKNQRKGLRGDKLKNDEIKEVL